MNELIEADLARYGYPPGTEVLTVRIAPEEGEEIIPGDYIWWDIDPTTGGWVIGEAGYKFGKRIIPAWKIHKGNGKTDYIFKDAVGGGIGLRPHAELKRFWEAQAQ